MSECFPSITHVSSLNAALRSFLATVELYAPFLVDTSLPNSTLARLATEDALYDLEKLLNPRRLPFEECGQPCVLYKLPVPIMQAITTIYFNIYSIVDLWDIKEICSDKPIVMGLCTIVTTDSEGKTTERCVDRPLRLFVVPDQTMRQLQWSLTMLEHAATIVAMGSTTNQSEHETCIAPASTVTSIPKPRRGGGRPKDTDEVQDKRVHDAWKTHRYKTYDDLSIELRIPRCEVKAALDRHRKRLEKQKRADSANT